MSHGHGHSQSQPIPTSNTGRGTESQIYGFVKCKVASDATIKGSRHKNETQYHLHASLQVTGFNAQWDVAVNVGTNDADDLLNYRLVGDFHHPLIATLKAASPGFHNLTTTNKLPALDFLRSDVLRNTGNWRESDVMIHVEDAKPYIDLKKLFNTAKAKNADVYIFGRRYQTGGEGIHDVHMNQGSRSPFLHKDKDGNAVWQDGAVLFDFGDPEWTAYFTAFTQQSAPTDKVGDPQQHSHHLTDSDPGSMASGH